MAVEVRLLGPPTVVVDGRELAVRGAQAPAVLAALALRAGRDVAVDVLADVAWGDDRPARAENALQALISRLRRLVGSEHITHDGTSYRLGVHPTDVDAEALAAGLVEGTQALRRGDPERARRVLDEALARWHGPLLGDAELRGALVVEGLRLREVHAALLEARVDAGLALGEHDRVDELEALVAEEPLREHRWEQLMLALYRCGRQADALRAFRRLRDLLVDELGVDPSPSVVELEARILAHDPGLRWAPLPAAAPATAAPATARGPLLIGRDEELARVLDAWRNGAPVVVTGPAGCGKTTLARAALASSQADERTGVAVVVDASRASTADDLTRILGNALGVDDTEDVAAAIDTLLQRRPGAALLDGSAVDGPELVAFIRRLRSAAPTLRLVFTSRHRVDLAAVGVVSIALGGLSQQDAVQLFRVGSAGRADATADGRLAELVDALDRLPLAVELAAARTRWIGVEQMLARETELVELAGGDVLRAAIDESWVLLGEVNALVYRRLGALPASFPLEAAEALCSERSAGIVVGAIADLCERSLLQLQEDGSRYKMLDTIRAHAAEKLEAAGETALAHRRLAAWGASLVLAAVPRPHAPEEAGWLRRIDADQETVLAALAWLADTDGDAAAPMAIALAQWFDQRGRVEEGLRQLQDLEGSIARRPAGDRARAAGAMSRFLERRGALDAARGRGSEAIELARAAGDPVLEARLLGTQAFLAVRAGDPSAANGMIERARELALEADDLEARLQTENAAAFLTFASGDLAGASRHWREASVAARLVGDAGALSIVLGNLACAIDGSGEPAEALVVIDESLQLARQVGEAGMLAAALTNRVGILRSLGRVDEARATASEALEVAERALDETTMGELLTHVSELALASGDRAAAQAAALHHTELARRNGWELERAAGLRDQAAVALRGGDPHTAVALLRSAADVVRARDSGSDASITSLLQEALAETRSPAHT